MSTMRSSGTVCARSASRDSTRSALRLNVTRTAAVAMGRDASLGPERAGPCRMGTLAETHLSPSGPVETHRMPKNLAIVPAYNEEASVASVVRELNEFAPDFDVLVVNDGST